MFPTALRRLLSRRNEAPTLRVRRQVCPPTLLQGLQRWPGHWREWLTGLPDSRTPAESQTSARSARGQTTLFANVRREFIDALDDVPGRLTDDTIVQIDRARSMRDLWHLRLDVFNLVSCHHNQAEADRRLARLNRHFQTRSPRSGFGALTRYL